MKRDALRKSLDTWIGEGLLTPDQAERIETFESQRSHRAPWILFGVVGLGVGVSLLGVVSLVAANWDALSGAVKLTGFFVAQALLAACFVGVHARATPAREGLLVALGLATLVGIGLVAQVYHVRSDGLGGLLFWLAATTPLLPLARRRLWPHLWCLGALAALARWTVLEGSLFVRLSPWSLVERFLVAGGLATCALAAALYWRRQSEAPPPEDSGTALREDAAGEKDTGPFARAPLHAFSQSLSTWAFFVVYGAGSVFVSLLWRIDKTEETVRTPFLALPFFGAVFLGAGLFAPARRRSLWGPEVHSIARAVGLPMVAAVLLLGLSAAIALSFEISSAVWGGLTFLGVCALLAISAAAAHARRLFSMLLVLMALRFLVAYFEILGSLALTGFGLLLSGAILLATAFGLRRFLQGNTVHDLLHRVRP